MSSDETKDVLKGSTLTVYRLLLSESKPLSIRAVQRKLGLSSPSLASYHLNKLEEVGFIKQTPHGYIVDKVLLGDFVRVRKTFIPKFLFYAIFFIFVLTVDLTIYKPSKITEEYIFHILVSLSATILLIYESIKVWSKEKIRTKTKNKNIPNAQP